MPDKLPAEHDHVSAFEKIRRVNDAGNEYWSSRDLAGVLGYGQYRNFEPVIERAKTACFNSGQRVDDHFADMRKMVSIGSKAERAVPDIYLSRYACYLIVQNADPTKPVVAVGQTYFAVQTRRQELADKGIISEDDLRLGYRRRQRAQSSWKRRPGSCPARRRKNDMPLTACRYLRRACPLVRSARSAADTLPAYSPSGLKFCRAIPRVAPKATRMCA